MFDRLKRILVESFVGAIALGYLFAQAALYFVTAITTPVGVWFTRKEYPEIMPPATAAPGLPLQAALPHLVSFVALLLVWYILLRWLYFTPPKKEPSQPAPDPGQVT